MTITTNERDLVWFLSTVVLLVFPVLLYQQNMFAKEPSMYIDPKIQEQMNEEMYETHNERAEKLNGRLAMISIMIGIISYLSTGKLFFFVW